jgi:hypothetical protein
VLSAVLRLARLPRPRGPEVGGSAYATGAALTSDECSVCPKASGIVILVNAADVVSR